MLTTELLLAASIMTGAGLCQEVDHPKIAAVTLKVVTSFGQPLSEKTIRVDGGAIHKSVMVHGVAVINLPLGAYKFAAEPSARYWGTERTVNVAAPKAFVLLAVAAKESFAVFGEGTRTPYTLVGTVAGNPNMSKLIARLIGMYLCAAAEAEVDENGRFEIAVEFQGAYDLQILSGESVVAQRPIHFDETTERPVRVRLSMP
jgi:hypothetical protein